MPRVKGDCLKANTDRSIAPHSEYYQLKVSEVFKKILITSGAHNRFRNILMQTKSDHVFLKAYELANDRAWGKAVQEMDIKTQDLTNRPSSDALIDTITALRRELDNLKQDSDKDKIIKSDNHIDNNPQIVNAIVVNKT